VITIANIECYNRAELMKILGVTNNSAFSKKKKREKIPFFRIGKNDYFRVVAVAEWLKARERISIQ
jgi:hypothetical protein